MRNKKGQITIFIIIGIVILSMIGLALYLMKINTDYNDKDILSTPIEFQPIKNYIQNCLENELKEGLNLIGRQGGYYDVPNESINFLFEEIPYYFINDKITFPSKTKIEEQISNYLFYNTNDCYFNLSVFEEQSYQIDVSEPKYSTSINKENILTNVNFILNIRKGNLTHQIEEFSVNQKSDLSSIIELSNDFVQTYAENPGYICLTCIDELSEKYDLNLTVMPHYDPTVFKNDIYWVVIKAKDGYLFRFVLEMQNTTESSQEGFLEEIDDFDAEIGYNFYYEVIAHGENLFFSDDTQLFDIDQNTGVIEFMPKEEDIGDYLIKIMIKDGEANYDYQYVKMNITGFNNNPIIDYIGYQSANVGEAFIYDINASDIDNHSIFYIASTDLFLIDVHSGIINFTATSDQTGDYEINITAIDSRGGYDIEKLYLVVTDE